MAEAPIIEIDRAAGRITIRGEAAWSNVRDGVFLARGVTPYTIGLPIAGTPFDPAFAAPALAPGQSAELAGRASLVVGDPKTASESDAADSLRMALISAPPAEVASGDSPFGLVLEPFTRLYQPGVLDGDQTFQAVLSFDAAFEALTAVIVGMQVRTPTTGSGGISDPFVSSDIFLVELYRGDHAFAPLDADAAGGAPPGPDPGGDPGGQPPVEEPGPAPGGGPTPPVVGPVPVLGDGRPNRLAGGRGDDTVRGGGGDDTLGGAGGADRLVGGPGRDRLLGGLGDDTLEGGAGDDRLVGGAGADRLLGGGGADAFVFGAVGDTRSGAADALVGFDRAGLRGGDRIDLSAIDARPGSRADDAFAFDAAGAGGLRLVERAGATLVLLDLGGRPGPEMTIRILDGATRAEDYDAADFVL